MGHVATQSNDGTGGQFFFLSMVQFPDFHTWDFFQSPEGNHRSKFPSISTDNALHFDLAIEKGEKLTLSETLRGNLQI